MGASSSATFFHIDQDLVEMNQRCDQAQRSIDTVEGTQMALMEVMGGVMRRISVLEDCHASKDQRIHMLEAKVEQGETLLLKVCEALELLLSKVCQCDERPVTLGSGLREVVEDLELEYTSKDEIFRTPALDLMTLVLERSNTQGE